MAASRLRDLGATVVKVEPPTGDPLARFAPVWYAQLHDGVHVRTLDLKGDADRGALTSELERSDLLLTSHRPSVLARLGLAWDALARSHPTLLQVAIVGYPAPAQERPGHDLTYLAEAGLVTPPRLPPTLLADLHGAERAAAAALALIAGRARGSTIRYVEVSLADAATALGAPLEHGLTSPGGALGGGLDTYRLYRCADGWVAVAALEPQFAERFRSVFGPDLEATLAGQGVTGVIALAVEHDLPIARVAEGRR